MEPDFVFYRDEYKGKGTEAAFYARLPSATAKVDEMIGFNTVTESTLTAYKRAICAVVDAYRQDGYDSLSIGSFSVSGGQTTSYDVAASELALTGLLYCGLM